LDDGAFAPRLLNKVLRPMAVMLALTISASIAAHAQETWQVDPQHSVARLSLGSGSNALEIGLARVSGDVVFESSDPADPSFYLSIKPDNGPQVDSAEMSFTSRRSTITSDGKLVVTGDLSITRIERSVTIEPNEAYHGPEYGEPVARTATQEVRLVVSAPGLPASRTDSVQISGATSLSREAFPQLLDALTQSDWPNKLVNDEKCDTPSTVGEDYSGAACSGTVIATLNNSVVTTGTAGGEGYYGFQSTVTPDPERGTITLDLEAKHIAPAASGVVTAAGK